MALPIVHLCDDTSSEFPLRRYAWRAYFTTLSSVSICLSFSAVPVLSGLLPGRASRLRDAMHCVQTSTPTLWYFARFTFLGSVATRLHADAFTQVEVYVPDVDPPRSLPTFGLYEELTALQGSAAMHSLCTLKGVVTGVLKVRKRSAERCIDGVFDQSSTLVSCCTKCQGEMAEWFTMETEGTYCDRMERLVG